MKTSKICLLVFISIFPILSFAGMLENKYQARQLLVEKFSPDEPGVQYVVVNKDSDLFVYSSGLADIKNNEPLSHGHTMSAFSMTKTLTAIAILQLVEREKIQLNSPVSQFVKHPYNSSITITQLLNHTSGIPNPIPLRWVHLASNHESFDENSALLKVLEENPISDSLPGEEYGYSNIGYWLLGEIIEKVSGEKYVDYIDKNIFKPLGLTQNDVGFQIINNANQTKGYLNKYSFLNLFKYFLLDDEILGDYEGSWLRINSVYLNGPAVGGAFGTSVAFSRILQNLLLDKSVLLGESAKRYLFSQQKAKSGEMIDMTLGLHIGELNGVKYYFKEGGGAGFHCEMRIYPDSGIVSVMMVNRTSFNTNRNLSKLDSSFIGE